MRVLAPAKRRHAWNTGLAAAITGHPPRWTDQHLRLERPASGEVTVRNAGYNGTINPTLGRYRVPSHP